MRVPVVVLVLVAALAGLLMWTLGTRPTGLLPDVRLDASRPKPQGDYLVQAVKAEPEGLSILQSRHGVRDLVLAHIYDTLLTVDPESAALAPCLAESWGPATSPPPAPDEVGRAFDLVLRKGVRFSDGTPLTTDDVLFTWKLVTHPWTGPMWRDVRLLQRVEALDDRRVRLVVAPGEFEAFARAATGYHVMQERWHVETVAVAAKAAGASPPEGTVDPEFIKGLRGLRFSGPGTGPLQLGRHAVTGEVLWRRGEDLLLVQNPHSWRRETEPDHWNIAGIRFLFVATEEAQRALLRRQEIDLLQVTDPQSWLADDPEAAANYEARSYAHLGNGPWFVIWNHEHEALADARVRRALSMLFDRAAIAKLLAPGADEARSWFPPMSVVAPEDPSPLPYGVDDARALLDEAGYGPGGQKLELTVRMPAGYDVLARIMEVARPDFVRAGVTLNVASAPIPVLIEHFGKRTYDGMVYNWSPGRWDDPHVIFHSSRWDRPGQNWMHYRSASMDGVLERARAEPDEERRRAHYRAFDRVFRQEQPMALLYHQRTSILLHRRFKGVQIGRAGFVPRGLWVEPEDRLHTWGTAPPAGR